MVDYLTGEPLTYAEAHRWHSEVRKTMFRANVAKLSTDAVAITYDTPPRGNPQIEAVLRSHKDITIVFKEAGAVLPLHSRGFSSLGQLFAGDMVAIAAIMTAWEPKIKPYIDDLAAYDKTITSWLNECTKPIKVTFDAIVKSYEVKTQAQADALYLYVRDWIHRSIGSKHSSDLHKSVLKALITRELIVPMQWQHPVHEWNEFGHRLALGPIQVAEQALEDAVVSGDIEVAHPILSDGKFALFTK